MNLFRPMKSPACIALFLLMDLSLPAQHTSTHLQPLPATACVSAVREGEVVAGTKFAEPIGGGLSILLDPIASGWVVRVEPVSGSLPAHDFAELATPPYKSVNPLLITTDFNFRAQDVVGWNPRQFQFFARATQADAAQRAYDFYFAHLNDAAAMERLAEMPQTAAAGTLTILNARLVPGTANQAPAAAMVAAHFQTTQHTLVQSPDGKGSPQGRVMWMKFRITLLLPSGFHPAAGWQVDRSRCPR